MQPAQASGITAQAVPRIQAQELCLKNTGAKLRDQALAQNLIIFSQQEKEHEQKELSGSADMVTLAHMISWTVRPAPVQRADQQQADADMDMMEKANGKMTEGTGAQQLGSSGSASKDAKEV